jgi:acetyl esterase/lipase
MDLFRSGGTQPKPAAVWIHSGALIQGSRKLAPEALVLRSLLDAGFNEISIDYRLAPETKLPGHHRCRAGRVPLDTGAFR